MSSRQELSVLLDLDLYRIVTREPQTHTRSDDEIRKPMRLNPKADPVRTWGSWYRVQLSYGEIVSPFCGTENIVADDAVLVLP